MPRLRFLLTGLVLFTYFQATGITAGGAGHYQGRPFEDSVYHGGPQKIPGRVECAYYDLGGEGVAYHDVDAKNGGSGSLNPADGTYLNQFRMNEAVGISYTKFRRETQIDDNPYDKVLPPENQLYVGWTQPGEWFNMTVEVARSGVYTIDLLYTSNRGGTISLERNGKKLTGPLQIVSTADPAETDRVASVAPLEFDEGYGRGEVAEGCERAYAARPDGGEYEFCVFGFRAEGAGLVVSDEWLVEETTRPSVIFFLCSITYETRLLPD